MGRKRDHRPRLDGSVCPDSDACERLYHGSIESGMAPGDTCECCGQDWPGEDPEEAPEEAPEHL